MSRFSTGLGKHTASRPPIRTADPRLVDDEFELGCYELTMHVEAYFATPSVRLPSPNFLSLVPISFQIRDAGQRYHLPMPFTPWGYSCDRGS